MASNRNNVTAGRPLKTPSLASERSSNRGPLTPRLAGNATTTSAKKGQILTPRLKQQLDGNEQETSVGSENVTPRSAKRMSRVESNQSTPTQVLNTTPSMHLRASTVSPALLAGGGNGNGSGSSTTSLNNLTLGRPMAVRSPMSDTTLRFTTPVVRSPVTSEQQSRAADALESRFFHASDVAKAEPEVKRPEIRKAATFVYADGQQEEQRPSSAVHAMSAQYIPFTVQASRSATRTVSPARSAAAGWQRLSSEHDDNNTLTMSPQILSPAVSVVTATSPFFAADAVLRNSRSPSPSKENIHLSYRKGVSQIFGSRPSPIPSPRTPQESVPRRPSLQRTVNAHRKSTSLSSIDSELASRLRRRSNIAQEHPDSSPLREETPSDAVPSSPLREQSSHTLDTGTDTPAVSDAGPLSPTKAISELAAEARRERKVMDLEISNSSLLAINTTLEREIRRQKAELKRFRRLSRAGRFSSGPSDGPPSRGEALGSPALEEEEFGDEYADFGAPSALSELYDDISSSDEDSSSITSAEPTTAASKLDRLAKDDRRLRADLEKHRDLLVQSQMMNQSIRRCMYATEEMIREGKKAVEYKVRVSDVRLGGRILTGHEDEDENGNPIEDIEVRDDEFDTLSAASPMSEAGVQDRAQSFIALWSGLGDGRRDGAVIEEETQTPDRDSGIEMEKASTAGLLMQEPASQDMT